MQSVCGGSGARQETPYFSTGHPHRSCTHAGPSRFFPWRWLWRFWGAACSVLMPLWLWPSEGGCQVKKVLELPWDFCCAADRLFYAGCSFTPRSLKAMTCLWAFAPQPFWICLSPGKVQIPTFACFRETGKNEFVKGYGEGGGWRSILLFCRLQKHKITLQLHRSTSIFVGMVCFLLICPYFLENQAVNC